MTRGTAEATPRSDRRGLSATAALVRRYDRDRFQTALFAPAARREALFALYAFNSEIARVRERVREPMLGRIRLQWWREVIAAAYAGTTPRQHEVVLPLTAAIRDRSLSRAHFDRLIDARERDLNDAPPQDMAALEDYAEASSAALVQLALEALGAREPAAHEAGRAVGIAYALAGVMRAAPFDARFGRARLPPRLAAAEIAACAAQYLAQARRDRRAIPRHALAALLPAIVAENYLFRLRRAGFDPFAAAARRPDPLQVWRLAAAALIARF